MMAITVLVTGFGQFPGGPVNPTVMLVKRLSRLRRPVLADVMIVPHIFQTRLFYLQRGRRGFVAVAGASPAGGPADVWVGDASENYARPAARAIRYY